MFPRGAIILTKAMKQKGEVFTGLQLMFICEAIKNLFLHVLMIGCPVQNFVTCKLEIGTCSPGILTLLLSYNMNKYL